ncbi:flagellar basal-body MS-ring/collar protein FliF [Bosea sp. BH3]|uniref:flagellar basal-body MS-ring/collar protein FliF n=1 Tax=Bosea sp. BH3 TaxID=2871701 RepID=UPI0021CB31AF|nr:flagellar basal-body MS-ring/collar protein FliF [Bosea sp. BH3]MCU4181071.1 flagellar M-ring protein FliF [Bosea sp. BH3]
MNALIEQFAKFGAARLAAMLAVTLVLVGFFGFVMLRMSQPTMSVLFTDLSTQDVNAIVKDLDTRGVRYELRNDGQTVLVAKEDVPRLRLDLAGKGIPSGGGVGYEIFDKGDAFSSTSFVQNINHLRALEGELARTIRSIGRVQQARVHLVIPERRLFERDREPPRASIALKLAGDLDAAQVRAVRHLVASAVDGLKPERVSIVDERGRLLADGAQSEQGLIGLGIEERQTTIQKRLKSQVEEIVASVVGYGRARVQVTADLDTNRVESRSENFDPESRVLRSSQNRNESSTTTDNNGTVTVGNELPGAQQTQGTNQNQRENSAKNEEVANYEISRTTRTEVLEGGRIKKLSVAVLVDGVYNRSPSGEMAYQPRNNEELERIGELVRTAVGFDQQRGDKVEVVNLRFADAPPPPNDLVEQTLMQKMLSFSKEDIVRFVELGVISLLTLIVLMTVVRPLLKQVLATDNSADVRGLPSFMRDAVDADGNPTGDPAGTGMPVAIGPDGEVIQIEPPASDRMLALAQIKGQLKAQSVEKIGQMVSQNPADSLAVLRSWIHEKSAA